MEFPGKINWFYEQGDVTSITGIIKNRQGDDFEILAARILVSFFMGDMKEYSLLLDELEDMAYKKNEKRVFPFLHLRRHLLFLYNEEYEKAIEELYCVRSNALALNYKDYIIKSNFQEIEINTYYLRDFKKAIDLLSKQEIDNEVIKAYHFISLAYIYSYNDIDRAKVYLDNFLEVLEDLDDKGPFYEGLIKKVCIVLLNIKELDKLPEYISLITEGSDDWYIINGLYNYQTSNYKKAEELFVEARTKFLHLKKFDEYWLKFFLMMGDITEKKGDNAKAKVYYVDMLEQLDYLYSKLDLPENQMKFRDFFSKYVYAAIFFFRRNKDFDKLEEIIDKYTANMLYGDKPDVRQIVV